jgi:hypothetical protein
VKNGVMITANSPGRAEPGEMIFHILGEFGEIINHLTYGVITFKIKKKINK